MKCLFWLPVLCAGVVALAANPDFDRDIRPVLQKRCIGCHGTAQQMGGVRFDDREQAFKGGYSGPVIVPGNAGASRLIEMITTGREGRVMPPAGARLSADEIALFRSWIDSGAVWPAPSGGTQPASVPKSAHWAFQRLRRPAVPKTASSAIDAFILEKLQKEGM